MLIFVYDGVVDEDPRAPLILVPRAASGPPPLARNICMRPRYALSRPRWSGGRREGGTYGLKLNIRGTSNIPATNAVITKQSSFEFTMCLKATKFDFGPCTERGAWPRVHGPLLCLCCPTLSLLREEGGVDHGPHLASSEGG